MLVSTRAAACKWKKKEQSIDNETSFIFSLMYFCQRHRKAASSKSTKQKSESTAFHPDRPTRCADSLRLPATSPISIKTSAPRVAGRVFGEEVGRGNRLLSTWLHRPPIKINCACTCVLYRWRGYNQPSITLGTGYLLGRLVGGWWRHSWWSYKCATCLFNDKCNIINDNNDRRIQVCKASIGKIHLR